MYKVQRARRTKLSRGRYVQEQNLLRAINLLFFAEFKAWVEAINFSLSI